jgi:hypothetical protein
VPSPPHVKPSSGRIEDIQAGLNLRKTDRFEGIPVHVAITVFIVLALVLTWRDMTVRRLLLVALVSYIVMRAWSGLFFIAEMLAFQKIPVDSARSAELSARVSKWTFWTWFREPLDIISFLCSLLALYRLKR